MSRGGPIGERHDGARGANRTDSRHHCRRGLHCFDLRALERGDEFANLRAICVGRRHDDVVEIDASGKRIRDEMRTVEQERGSILTARGGAKPADERVLTARNASHGAQG